MSVPLLSQAQVNEPESAEPYVPPESAVPSASELGACNGVQKPSAVSVALVAVSVFKEQEFSFCF